MDLDLHLLAQLLDVDALEDLEDRLGAHARLEDVAVALLHLLEARLGQEHHLVVLGRVDQFLQLLDAVLELGVDGFALAAGALLERLQLVEDHLALLVGAGVRHEGDVVAPLGVRLLERRHALLGHLLQALDDAVLDHGAALDDQRVAQAVALARGFADEFLQLRLVFDGLLHDRVGLLLPLLFELREFGRAVPLDLLLRVVELLLQLGDPVRVLLLAAHRLALHLLLQVLEGALLRVLVHGRDDELREVEDALQRARRDVEQESDAARRALHEPDVTDGRSQLNVPHALAAHLRACHLDAALVADDALVADALVLAAVALEVLRRTEDLLAEEPVLLRLQRAVVDRLRLRDLPV